MNWLRSWTSGVDGKRNRRWRTALGLEPLEERALLSAGALDVTFGVNGKALGDLVSVSQLEGPAAALQPDGRIVTAGTVGELSASTIGVTRFNPDGSPDTTFGTGGVVLIDVSPGREEAAGVLVQPDGKIVVAGTAGSFALARLNPDGSLDTGFGTNGAVVTPFENVAAQAAGVALHADGRIVVAGFAFGAGGGSQSRFALARYLPDGTLDADFDADGRVVTDFAFAQAFDVLVQPDGRIVVAGISDVVGTLDVAVARFLPDGSPDSTFGNLNPNGGFGSGNPSGLAVLDLPGVQFANGVALQADGRIVVAGVNDQSDDTDFLLVRFNPDGSVDSGFSASGRITGFGRDSNDAATDVAVGADGKIIAAGVTDAGGGGNNFALARFNPDGSLDASFSFNGGVVTDFAGGDDEASAVLVQPDGRIVAAGTAGGVFALARYEGDNALPPPPPDAVPAVQSVVVNDGSAQRSMVTSITVTFSEVVTLDSGAFELARADGSLVGVVATVSMVNGKTLAVLTFSGADILGGSLADGNYTLTIRAEKVHDSAGQALDGNRVSAFFRLFGDADGDRDADDSNRDLFRGALGTGTGQAGFLSFFDFDGDGDVDNADKKEFNRRFGSRVPA